VKKAAEDAKASLDSATVGGSTLEDRTLRELKEKMKTYMSMDEEQKNENLTNLEE
jgi:hypothetical protein